MADKGSDKLMTAAEVAHHLGVPVPTLYQWRYKGTGPRGMKVGRHLRYRRTDIERHLDALAGEARRTA
jgi:excisionase family DNA binding protein